MSDTETEAPRRSQRDRKRAKPFQSQEGATLSQKRKRGGGSDDEEPVSDPEDVPSPAEDANDDAGADSEEEDPKPKTRKRAPRKSAAAGDAPAKKRRRPTAKGDGVPKSTSTRRSRKKAAGGEEVDGAEVAKESNIASDNALFNTLLNPAAALQSTVEDFLESLSDTPAPALADLINCVLRACGCNDSVDADTVVDYDGVVDALDNFTEALKQEDTPVYPLTSKLHAFKKFRKSLSEFLERTVASAADLGLLYSTDLMTTLNSWVIAMSSSQLRSFRHTATVIALEVETALCDVAAAVEKEAEVVGRQREGEKKRRAGKAAKAAAGRDKDLESKATEIRDRRDKLSHYIQEFLDGVFVHRYRDLDANIRMECIQAMGRWFKKHPSHFLESEYLRYIGWVLSDKTTAVRLAAVRALAEAYAQTDHVGSISGFTERFKPRLVEMAQQDTEPPVRTAVAHVLAAVDGAGLLDDDQRAALCELVFDEEPRVRRAVAGFVRGVWEEAAAERLLGRDGEATAQEKQFAGAKALATLLIQWGKALDKAATPDDDSQDGTQSQSSADAAANNASVVPGADQPGRIPLVVEALWEEVDVISEWQTLLDLLLLDHSATGDAQPAKGRGRRGKNVKSSGAEVVDEAWRLDEAEEGILLELLVSALRQVRDEAAAAKKGEGDEVLSELTRSLIKALPPLFVKHQTDRNRIIHVLRIPELMSLDMYLEMRMMNAYGALWDDVTKQLLSHTSSGVVTQAIATILHLMNATSLSNTNSTKILELDDELASSLRDVVGGRDELEMATFTEDEVLSLTAICARLSTLSGRHDMTAWADEDEGGKQSSAWDILAALAERGRLGYKEEEMMVEHALYFMMAHVIWRSRGLTRTEEPSPEEVQYREKLEEQRSILLNKVTEFAIGTQSNTLENVKRAAFQVLMTMHVLFSAQTTAEDGSARSTAVLGLTLDDEAQYRCAGYIQAEIERFAELLASTATDDADDEASDSASDSEEGTPKAKKAKPKKKKNKRAADVEHDMDAPPPPSVLQHEYAFLKVVASFLRAVCTGAINVRHGAVLLASYGRLGPAYDLCVKALIDALRDEGIRQGNGAVVSEAIIQAIRDSFSLFLEGAVDSEENTIALAKALVPCLMARGAQLAIVGRLDSQDFVNIHTSLLTWIGKRLGALEANKKKAARNTAATFFKAMTPLLASVESRDALRIKAHMDQVLAQAKVEISMTSKIWDGQRAYEKRLVTAMSKDKAKKPRGKAAKAAGDATTEDEGLDEEHDEVPAPSRRAPKLRPRPRRAAAKDVVATDEDEDAPGEPADASEDDVRAPSPPPIARTPARRSRRGAPAAEHAPASPSPLPPSSPVSPVSSVAPASVGVGATPLLSQFSSRPAHASTPRSSRKRVRDAENVDGEENAPASVPDAPHSPTPSEGSQFSEIVLTRKRARH